jgi:TIR domain
MNMLMQRGLRVYGWTADHVLCVISTAYLSKPYSTWERRSAQWAAITDRPNFLLPVFIEPCKTPTLLATLKRCDLYGLEEADARARGAEDHHALPQMSPGLGNARACAWRTAWMTRVKRRSRL